MIPTREEMHRVLVERHGAALQARFDAGRVAVCGLGGLGSNVAIALARAGVGHLHLMDFDRVDVSNLNRQQYTVDQLGLPKTQALADTLRRIAPYCIVETDAVRVTAENLRKLLAEDDIIAKPSTMPRPRPCWCPVFWSTFPTSPWWPPPAWRVWAAPTLSSPGGP